MAITLSPITKSSSPFPVVRSSYTTHLSTTVNKQKRRSRVIGNFEHFLGVVKKDFQFMKNGIRKGVQWANETLQVPKIAEKVEDALWLRNLEDPNAQGFVLPSWPQPYYPALSGLDLFVADLKALEAYSMYFYSMSKIWSRPLPENYDPQEVADYFNCRPHIVAFRILEVIFAFSAAVLKIRISRIKRFLKSSAEEDTNDTISQYAFGIVLKETMLNLGPTFIKVGQSLSTRPDIIGSEITQALSGLHDQIPPFPRSLAMEIIEEEIGAPVQKSFSYISEDPVAAASFGQVYRGTTLDGCVVAIKVQRPNLHHVVVRDIYILRLGLGLLQKIAKRKNDPRLYADELGKGFVGELDYRLEAANASQFLEAHSQFSFIRVPKVFEHLTQKRVLTMEWMVGENPNDLLLASKGASTAQRSGYSKMQKFEAKQHLLDMVSKGVEASLIQLLETGFLHADPHPGNLRYTTSGQIGFLDFGLMCRMERKHQLAMLASIVHIVNADWASLVQSLSDMDIVRPDSNMRRVTLELENSLGEVEYRDGIPNVKFSRVLGKIWYLALKYHFRMPPYYTLVLRSLASLEGLAVAADENFKTFEAAYPYVVRKLLTDNSDDSRRILHSVVLNKRKEFQWQKLALFLRVGATRKGFQKVSTSNVYPSSSSSTQAPRRDFDVADFVLRLLPSKDGVVLRRLLMTANGVSLVRAFLSVEAVSVRRQLCEVIAEVLYNWMSSTLLKGIVVSVYNNQARTIPSCDYQFILKDRRLKVVFHKVLDDTRRDLVLMLRFYLAAFVMVITAAAMAFHRAVVSLTDACIGPATFAPLRVAFSTGCFFVK